MSMITALTSMSVPILTTVTRIQSVTIRSEVTVVHAVLATMATGLCAWRVTAPIACAPSMSSVFYQQAPIANVEMTFIVIKRVLTLTNASVNRKFVVKMHFVKIQKVVTNVFVETATLETAKSVYRANAWTLIVLTIRYVSLRQPLTANVNQATFSMAQVAVPISTNA